VYANFGKQALLSCPHDSCDKSSRVGRSPRTAADAPSASALNASEEPDHGSGADDGFRPTTKYAANFRDGRLVA
jgi:hypothetical protein